MATIAEAGQKRKRKASGEGAARKRKKESVVEAVEEFVADGLDHLAPPAPKRVSQYEVFSQSKRFEACTGPPIIELDTIRSKNVELWLFQLPKTVRGWLFEY